MVDLTEPSERGRLIGFNDLLSALLGASLALLGGYALDSIGVAALAIGATVIVAAPVLWLRPRAGATRVLAEYSVAPPHSCSPRRLPMSELLARLARTLTHHWKRSLLVALVVIVALMGAASRRPGRRRLHGARHGDQQAIDLFNAHTPALAGVDSTIVYSVEAGRLTDPLRAPRSRARWPRSRSSTASRRSPTRSPRAARSRRTAGSPPSTSATRTDPGDIEKEDGEALLEAAETGERDGVDVAARGVLIDFASEQEAPVGELVGVAVAIVLLTCCSARSRRWPRR